MKEDGSAAEVGERLDFQVVEFVKNEKRIVLSHTHTHSDVQDKKKSKKGGAKKGGKAGTPENKSTLGDLDALAQLKEQMKNND